MSLCHPDQAGYGFWRISKFFLEHNHSLVPDGDLLDPLSRRMDSTTKQQAASMLKSGMDIHTVVAKLWAESDKQLVTKDVYRDEIYNMTRSWKREPSYFGHCDDQDKVEANISAFQADFLSVSYICLFFSQSNQYCTFIVKNWLLWVKKRLVLK